MQDTMVPVRRVQARLEVRVPPGGAHGALLVPRHQLGTNTGGAHRSLLQSG